MATMLTRTEAGPSDDAAIDALCFVAWWRMAPNCKTNCCRMYAAWAQRLSVAATVFINKTFPNTLHAEPIGVIAVGPSECAVAMVGNGALGDFAFCN